MLLRSISSGQIGLLTLVELGLNNSRTAVGSITEGVCTGLLQRDAKQAV